MPTPVRAHWSHSTRGRRFRVERHTRYGPEHTAKWKHLVADIRRRNRRRGTHYNPEAVATSVLGRSGTFRGER